MDITDEEFENIINNLTARQQKLLRVLKESGKALHHIVVGSFLFACGSEQGTGWVKFSNHTSKVLWILNIANEAIVRTKEGNVAMGRLGPPMSWIVPAPKHAVWAPAPVIDVRQIVALLLLLAGLRGSRKSSRYLDTVARINVDFVIHILKANIRFRHRVKQHINIINRIPTIGSRSHRIPSNIG